MERSRLHPFLRTGLDLLFVGLNPALGSSRQGHYFSVRPDFWNQLYKSGLITSAIDEDVADTVVFGSTRINANGWQYGVTDLVPAVAESNSADVSITGVDCGRLVQDIKRFEPRAVVLMHSKVISKVAKYFRVSGKPQYGCMGRLLGADGPEFFAVAFPHGNGITAAAKVAVYRQVKAFLEA